MRVGRSRDGADMTAPDPIYLDGHATTPLAPEAEAAMAPLWRSQAANPSSPHAMGMRMAAAVESARRQVAALLGADAQEIVFTSGATEANNIALLGIAAAAAAQGIERRRVLMSAVEHKSVLATAAELSRRGYEVAYLPVDQYGVVDLERARVLITTDTLLVSVMTANNEVGVVQPIKEIARIARSVGAVVHTDAAQAAGKIPLDVFDLDVDLASISSHKMYGPGGVGALFVSATSPLRPLPLVFGGDQEGGLRSGTVPGSLVVGFGTAARLCSGQLAADAAHAKKLSDMLLEELRQRQVPVTIHAQATNRLPGSLCVQFNGVDAEQLIATLSDRVCISSGSACSSGQLETSHVLKEMGINPIERDEIVRIYCGRYNTEAEMTSAGALIAEAVRAARAPTGRPVQ